MLCSLQFPSMGQDALNKSGYQYNLSYNDSPHNIPRTSRNRQRNNTWFNPPYSKNPKTNVGRSFLSLIDHHFPKSNPLHKIFNRNTLKLSYSCISNIKTTISNHIKLTSANHQHPLKERKTTVTAGTKIALLD